LKHKQSTENIYYDFPLVSKNTYVIVFLFATQFWFWFQLKNVNNKGFIFVVPIIIPILMLMNKHFPWLWDYVFLMFFISEENSPYSFSIQNMKGNNQKSYEDQRKTFYMII